MKMLARGDRTTWMHAMRNFAIAIVLVATPALAQPGQDAPPADAHDAAPCQATVTLSRAPDDVRAVVDTWVHSEPSCSHALDVSVDAVDDGYVVNARDSSGRLRVRIVPDSQTLAVLIASWSADDRLDPQGPLAVAAEPPRAPQTTSEADALAGPRLQVAAVMGEATGARVELDLFGHRIPVGIAGSAAWTAQGSQRWLQALAYLGVAFQWQRWQLRAQLGAGVQQTHSDLGLDNPTVIDPIIESSLTVSWAMAARWRLTGGVVITEPLIETWPYSDGPQYNESRWNEPKPAALVGVSWEL